MIVKAIDRSVNTQFLNLVATDRNPTLAPLPTDLWRPWASPSDFDFGSDSNSDDASVIV